MLAIRRILHPTDFSDLSRPAFELACSLARDYAADLLVLHVLPPALIVAPNGVAVTGPTDETDRVRERLEAIRPTDPRVTIGHRLAEGNPVGEILRAAQDAKADLIVMGTHGHTGLSRLLMGSVAEGVMRKAPCPVLTARAPSPSGQAPEPEAAAPSQHADRWNG
ncbi:MAG: universal stress protein [Gemmataceae bacterium]|nr:universal stress protein [Gemmataceae bacterium]